MSGGPPRLMPWLVSRGYRTKRLGTPLSWSSVNTCLALLDVAAEVALAVDDERGRLPLPHMVKGTLVPEGVGAVPEVPRPVGPRVALVGLVLAPVPHRHVVFTIFKALRGL